MSKPLLLFGPIFDFTVESFIEKLNDVPSDEDVDIWLNSAGGSVFAGWSLVGALKKRTGKNNISVFGNAASMAFIFMMFGDNVEALDVTQFLVHRADGRIETPEDQTLLDDINMSLRQKLESKVDKALFEEVTGTTFDEIFKGENRKDVWISAKQAKKMRFINSIKRLSPEEAKAYSENFVAFYEPERGSNGAQGSAEDASKHNINNNNFKKMTVAELKAQHPELFNAVLAEGVMAGINSERERVQSFLAFIDYDKDNVLLSVKKGEAFSQAIMAEMTVKITAFKTLAGIKKDNAGNTNTGDPDNKTAGQKEAEAFEKQVMEGVKKIKLF